MWRDRKVLAIAKKVATHPDAKFAGKTARGARVVVTVADGRAVETEIMYPKGDVGNRVTREELTTKFRSLATMSLSEQRVEQIIGMVNGLEGVEDVSGVMPLLIREP
jgi:2-methylcitrate dehydratase PrpD